MHHDTPSKPHVYTQEEAVQMNDELSRRGNTIRELELTSDYLKGKLNIALQCMEKEQLIEFINKTLF